MNCQSKLDWFWIYGIVHSIMYNLNEWSWPGDFFMIHLICMFEFFPQDLCFVFWTFKRDILLVWPFFALPHVFWKENCHFCVYVALNYWIHCFTIARLEVTLLSAKKKKSLVRQDNISKGGLLFHKHCCWFSQDKPGPNPAHKTNGVKLMSQCYFSLRPKSCLHPTVHIVFSDAMFQNFELLMPQICQ